MDDMRTFSRGTNRDLWCLFIREVARSKLSKPGKIVDVRRVSNHKMEIDNWSADKKERGHRVM